MFCEVCGKENSQFVTRCSYCNGKLVKDKPSNPEPAYKKLEAQIAEQKRLKEESKLNIDMTSEIVEFGPREYVRMPNGERYRYRPHYKSYIDLYDRQSYQQFFPFCLVVIIITSLFTFFVNASKMGVEGNDDNHSRMIFITAIIVFVVSLIIFLIYNYIINRGNTPASRKNPASQNSVIFSLRMGKPGPAIIKRKYKEEIKNETQYLIVFRYAYNDKTYEATQRVRKETYSKMFEGDQIEICLDGSCGVIDEHFETCSELEKRLKPKGIHWFRIFGK